MASTYPRPPKKATHRFRLLGIIGTIAIHATLLAWPMGPLGVHGSSTDAPDQPPRPISGLRLLSIGEPPDEAQAEPSTTPSEPLPSQPELELPDGAAVEIPRAEFRPLALRPRLSDSRLWRPSLGLAAPDLASERDVLRYRIRLSNARAAEAPPNAPGTAPWVLGRSGGEIWGASPGVFHAGSVSIPTCGGSGLTLADCGFGLTPSQRLRYQAWRWRYSEIEEQARRAEIEGVWKARAAATRMRLDSQRDTTRSDR